MVIVTAVEVLAAKLPALPPTGMPLFDISRRCTMERSAALSTARIVVTDY
jgi:hypothetical protein